MNRSNLRHGVGLILILTLAAAGVSGVLAAGESSPVADPTEADIRHATSFRASLGFQGDESFVRATYDDAEGYPNHEWGMPLSSSEGADLAERGRLRTLTQPAVDHALAQPDSAGVWFDQQQGGRAHFSFAGDVAFHEAELAVLMPEGAEWEVVAAEYSMAELRSLQAEITADFADLVAAGITVTQVVASARENLVVVGLEEDQEVEAELRVRYGPAVGTELIGATEDDACNSRTDCRPLKGGLKIMPRDGGTRFCSSAFQAEKNGDRMLVTAGHCVQEWGVGHVWEHDSDPFGTGANDTLPPPGSPQNPVNADADLGWIRIDSGESVTPANQFMANGPTDVRSFTYIAANASQQEGDTVCRSGATTFWKCGQIINTAASKANGEGHMITNVWIMDVDASGGDSGGIYVEPQYHDSQGWRYPAAGVHVHSGNDDRCIEDGICRSWYSTAQDLEDLTQLVICRSSDC